ncbi:TraE/TraK family type IV conjugative transfer system protein [Thermodesulfovibrio yellowstonii]|uniref:TraE/TraK family type IV conjugative transfer system protein n=1 Tax=Thermodesulfovibrio yellowstonii TaxID=28262 RepID=UPI000418ECEB|nr:TraE/TraK family type IV conjugative transfer system protein [Thermodesulfovibrio islandicus]
MQIKKYLSEKENYALSIRVMRFFIVVIGVVVLIQSFMTYALYKSQKVVLVPPSLSTQAFVSGSDASDEYLRAMARYVCILALTYSPQNARAQFSEFLKLVNPGVVGEYKKIFYDLADKSETAAVSSSFFISKIEVDRQARKMIVTGVLNQWTGDKKFITDEIKKYHIAYSISDGMFYVREFKVEGGK